MDVSKLLTIKDVRGGKKDFQEEGAQALVGETLRTWWMCSMYSEGWEQGQAVELWMREKEYVCASQSPDTQRMDVTEGEVLGDSSEETVEGPDGSVQAGRVQ